MNIKRNFEITILAFNYGIAGGAVNGPGICLYNFINFLKQNNKDIKINLFTYLNCSNFNQDISIYSIRDYDLVSKLIKRSDVVHHWSGIRNIFSKAIKLSNNLNKAIIVGPNVIDTVNFKEEKEYFRNIEFNTLLTANKRLKYKISKEHNIDYNKIKVFMVGPDLNTWAPIGFNNNKILWKGNSGQHVKDVGFALEVKRRLPQYSFDFFGYPEPYDYFDHINSARQYRLYFSTSLSETMGMALAEQWAAGVPSVTHPEVYLHGKNYETGIIANRNVDSYCSAISEIMENCDLHRGLSVGARRFAENFFNPKDLIDRYISFFEK